MPPTSSDGSKILSCLSCKRDLSAFPSDVIVCPYCGASLREAESLTLSIDWRKLTYGGLTLLLLAILTFFFDVANGLVLAFLACAPIAVKTYRNFQQT